MAQKPTRCVFISSYAYLKKIQLKKCVGKQNSEDTHSNQNFPTERNICSTHSGINVLLKIIIFKKTITCV